MKKPVYTFWMLCLILLSGRSLNAQVMIFAEVPGECAPIIVNLINNSDVSISDTAIWEWRISRDNNGDYSEEFYEDFDLAGKEFQAGYYYVTLTLYDGPNYKGEDYTYFEIYPTVKSFNISSGTEACPGEPVSFNFDESISYYSVQWTFGDNTVPESQHQDNWPNHTFYTPGLYDVTLIVEHYCGPDTVTRPIAVGGTARPTVMAYLTNGPDFCPSDPVRFAVEGEYTSYHWDFGDGTFSKERRPSHVYPAETATSYTATVTVTNICGNSGSSDVQVFITEDIEADANFEYYSDAQSFYPCPGSPVKFDAWGAGIYEWDFGDGSISNQQKPVYHYSEPGIYDVGLTVWNGCGNMDFSQQTIEIQLNFSDSPNTDFYFQLNDQGGDQGWQDTLIVCPGMPVNFVDATWTYNPSDLSYNWDFGDGTNAFARNASHIFNTPSAIPYQVTLNVSNSCGGSSSRTRYVRVDNNLKPDVLPMVVPRIICPGEEVFFYLEEGMVAEDLTFDITFGDGNVLSNARGYGDSILQTVASHVYHGTDGQPFEYYFNVTNACGNTLQAAGTVVIDTDPQRAPFYYVSNSTAREGSGQFNNWSSRQNPTDHEFVIHIQWSTWPGTQDKFAVYFWYDGFDSYDPGPADGYVEFRSSTIMEGDSVHAFIPINPMYPPVIGFAVGWNCDGQYGSADIEPDVWAQQLDYLGYPQDAFPIVPGGYTNMLSIGNPVFMDPGWDGICNKDQPATEYYYQLNPGQYIQLSLDPEYSYYSIHASGDRNGYDWIADIDYGDYYLVGDGSMELISWQACGSAFSSYNYMLDGDQMNLVANFDDCSGREKYLAGKTFLKQSEMGEAAMFAGCPGDEILFSVAGGASYEWHFGDGSALSNEQHPRHSYALAGDYNAYVVAVNNCGRTDTVYTRVRISSSNLPGSDFWWEGDEFPRMQPINFYYIEYGYDQAGNYSYFWEFGDGNTSTLKNPVHAYERNGNYSIKLTVSNGCGSNSSVKMIYISDAILNCEAKIQVDSVSGRTVYFRDISRGEINKWFWDFGDGFTSAVKSPVHTYDRDGVYFVCLSVFDETSDCSHQVCRMVEIGTQQCVANFTGKVNQATGNVKFTDLSSNATEWFWEFGDGEFDFVKNPEHLYTEPGSYVVCLSVYNDVTDCFAFRCMDIQVGENDPQYCFADFEYFVNVEDNSVRFTDRSSDNSTDWYWTFGDGTYKEERSPTKKYTGPGIYNVCLFVFDKETGCRDEVCMQIPVGVAACNLRSDFAYFIDVNTNTVSFSDRSGGKPTDYFWDFGDGTSSSARSPKHTYYKPGFYLVTLSIWDETNDCGDHSADFLQMGQVDCRAGFEYKVDAASNNVQFYNRSRADVGSFAEYFWDFDDGTYSNLKDPQHYFSRPGLYFVSLTVITADGLCMDFVFKPIQVGTVDCAAKFKYYIDSATNVAYFTPVNIGSATDYLWFFGDGDISTRKEARHAFTRSGYYTVGLNTYNANTDCMDYWEEVIMIGSAGIHCRANFSFISDPVTKKIKFGNRSQGNIIEYLWDFGDGNRSSQKDPENQYAVGGYYMVCLTVVNNYGIPNTHCDFVQLVTGDDERCFADFIYAVDSASKTVEFVQQSYGDPDVFRWNFGDGSTSGDENPVHQYGDADFYLVKLTVNNSTANCSHTGYALINVSEGNQGLQSAFSYQIDSSNLKAETYPVDFIGVSLGDAGKLKWTFGDGAVDTTSLNPTHVYENPGMYTACLIISDPITGDADTTCQQVTTPGYVGIENEAAWRSIIGNYPNPFDLATHIYYELPAGSSVDLVLFDQTGRMIDLLVHEKQGAGRYQIEYDGSRLDSGIYTLRLSTDQGVFTARMVVR